MQFSILIQSRSQASPFLFFGLRSDTWKRKTGEKRATLLLPCTILNTNWRTKNGRSGDQASFTPLRTLHPYRPLPSSGYIVRSTDATDGKNSPRVLSSPPYSSSPPPTPNPWQEVPRVRVTQILRPRQNIPTGLVVKTESQMMASRKPGHKQTPKVGRGRQGSSDKKRPSVKAGREVGGRSVPGSHSQYDWNRNGRLEELKIRFVHWRKVTTPPNLELTSEIQELLNFIHNLLFNPPNWM